MNLGLELVACALRESSLQAFTEAGITDQWLNSLTDLSSKAILDGADRDAWNTLARHWGQHGKLPTLDMFRRSHPAETYRLPDSSYTPDELIEIWREDRQRYLTQLAASDIADLVAAGDIAGAVEMMELSSRVIKQTFENQSVVVDWDADDYDLEGRIDRKITQGIRTGIPGLDSQFWGFQPGNLICLLGRAKAGKTSFALLSAIDAWKDGRKVLFLTFEIAAGKLPTEPGVADRLDCFVCGLSLTKYMAGELNPTEQRALRDFRAGLAGQDATFRIIQPTSRYTVTELEADIDSFEPDVVYIDGFYFMTDRITDKPGGHWEGHDNLAGELKRTAMNRSVPVILTHQVREKQLTGKKGKGIDDSAMMGGTAIIMYADMVLGVDVDDSKLRTVSCTRSRLNYLNTVFGTWDWDDCTFNEQAAPVDESKYGYAKGEDNEDAPF